MKSSTTLRGVLLATFLGVFATLAMARSAAMVEPGRVQIDSIAASPVPSTPERVHRAILAGAGKHSWQVTADKPGQVTLEASSGQHHVVVDVSYDAQTYQIAYQSSQNMNYELVDGQAHIHPKYNRWVSDLGTAIRTAAHASDAQ